MPPLARLRKLDSDTLATRRSHAGL